MRALFQTWLPTLKREILSLVGTLQHATKIVRPGRAFVSQMYFTAFIKLCKLHFMTRLNVTGLLLWYVFSQSCSGLSILCYPAPCAPKFPSLNGCIKGTELCSSVWFPMATMAVVVRMIRHCNHCQGTTPPYFYLHILVPYQFSM